MQEFLGITKRPISFDTTQTAWNSKKVRDTERDGVDTDGYTDCKVIS
jgi:hypothetical protein